MNQEYITRGSVLSSPLGVLLMATENKRVAAYLPPHVAEKFEEYKQQNGGLSDSKAIIKLVSDHLGITDGAGQGGLPFPVTLTPEQKSELKSELRQEMLGELRDDMLAMFREQSEVIDVPHEVGELPSTLPGELKSLLGQPELPIVSELRVTQGESLVFTSSELGNRLGVSQSTVRGRVANGLADFVQWSAKKDPDGIAWEFYKEGTKSKFKPASDTPPEPLSRLTGS